MESVSYEDHVKDDKNEEIIIRCTKATENGYFTTKRVSYKIPV